MSWYSGILQLLNKHKILFFETLIVIISVKTGSVTYLNKYMLTLQSKKLMCSFQLFEYVLGLSQKPPTYRF